MNTKLKKTFDINDQKQIFETIFHKSVDGILIMEDGIFVECNDSVVHMLKYEDKDQFLNTHPSELSPEFQPDGRSSFAAAEENTRVVLKEGSRSFEWVHKKADGQEFWVSVVLTNISTKDKTRFLVIWRDIDEKKKMECELKELNETLEKKVEKRTKKLQESFEIISKHVIYSKSDLDGNITDVSEAFCKITGYYRDELIGRNHNILKYPNMPKSIYEDMWKTIKSGKSWIGKLKNIKKDGDYYWTVQVITPEFDEKGDIVGYMSIRDDVTSKLALRDLNDTLEEKIKIKTQDLKKLNENLEKRVKEAVEETKEKESQLYEMSRMAQMGEMIENIAHQWRQPLGAISAVANSVSIKQTLDNLNTDDIPKYMQEIEDYTQYLSQTIDTFRNFIKDSKELQEVVLQEYIDNTLYIIDSTIKANNIELIKEIDYLK
ncbi:MAG: PAS domain S-box protein, partial [Sulfurimonas sp.]|nr:PAS domain S-box protein [Sulfurimonas sp.]